MARWAQEAYEVSERHAARLVKLAVNTLRYQSRKIFDEMLRHRLRELAGPTILSADLESSDRERGHPDRRKKHLQLPP